MVSRTPKLTLEPQSPSQPGDAGTGTSTTVDPTIDCCTASIIHIMSHVLDLLSVLAIMLGLLHRVMWTTQPQSLSHSHVTQPKLQHLSHEKSQQSSVQIASSDSTYSFLICPQIMLFSVLSLCWKHRGKIGLGGSSWLTALKTEVMEMFDMGMTMEPSYRSRMLWSGTNMIHARTRLAVVPLMTIVEEDGD